MARMRLNDTAAIAATPLGEGESKTVSVCKENGQYSIRRSEYNPRTGQYKDSVEHSEVEPRVTVALAGPQGSDAAGSRGLSDTKAYLSYAENKRPPGG
jgi:hypothetical protein